MSRNSVDVLVVAFNSSQRLPALQSSLRLLSAAHVVRLAIHDNSGDSELATVLASETASGIPISVDVCEENCGFARGCNELASQSDAEWFLFLNPDARIAAWPADWLPTPGLWGPILVDEDGRPEKSHGRDRSVLAELRILFGAAAPRPPSGYGWVSGAAILVDRGSFSRLGGFDDGYFMYYEDVDIGLRASAMGVPVNINPDWIVEHSGGHSVGGAHAVALERSYESALRFHRARGQNWRVFALGWAVYCTLRVLHPKWRGSSKAFARASGRAWRDLIGIDRSQTNGP